MPDEASVQEQWVEANDFFNSLVIVSDCLENNLCQNLLARSSRSFISLVPALGVGHHVRWPRAQSIRGAKLTYVLCTYNMATDQLVYAIAV